MFVRPLIEQQSTCGLKDEVSLKCGESLVYRCECERVSSAKWRSCSWIGRIEIQQALNCSVGSAREVVALQICRHFLGSAGGDFSKWDEDIQDGYTDVRFKDESENSVPSSSHEPARHNISTMHLRGCRAEPTNDKRYIGYTPLQD